MDRDVSSPRKTGVALVIALALFGGTLYHVSHEWRENENQLALVVANQVTIKAALADLLDAKATGPRHTACDTKAILADARRLGVDLPHYEVEDRCK